MKTCKGFVNGVLLLGVLRLTAVLLFCRGYLLSRRELASRSHCTDFARQSLFNKTSPGQCWRASSYDRLILLVIDGLRFDCVLDESCQTRSSRAPHIGRFPKLTQWKDAALLFKFIADPPTSTTTRLKAMMTGGLPTLFDVGNTFSGRQVTEDHLLSQLKSQHKRIAFVGDDTWDALFSDSLDISIPYPSFDVQDLDTVDDGHFYPLVLERPELWDVAIGHYLGVDHAGHVFGVPSYRTAEKLKTMDDDISLFLENLIKSEKLLEDRCLLLVFGDHAMTLSGDHGSGSKEEVETVLFAFDVQKLSSLNLTQTTLKNPSICVEDYEVLKFDQIDFAATLAALLDVPIPFGSIGKISEKLFNLGSSNHDLSSLKQALWVNAWQINQYLNDYSKVASRSFRRNLQSVNDVYKALGNSNNNMKAFDEYFEKASSFAKIHWTRFDDVSILIGLSLFFLTLPLHVYLSKIPVLDLSVSVPNGVVLLHGLFFFSDSFINGESYGTSFFIATFALWIVWNCLKSDLDHTEQTEISKFVAICLISNSLLGGVIQEGSSDASGVVWNVISLVSGILSLYGLQTMMKRYINEKRPVSSSQTKIRKFCCLLLTVQLMMVSLYWTLTYSGPEHCPFCVMIAQTVYLSGSLSLLIITGFRLWDSIPIFSVLLLSAILPSMLIVSGEKGSVVLVLTWLLVEQFKKVLFLNVVKIENRVKLYLIGVICHYSASQVFYLTGHFCKFSGLNFNAAFHGLTEFHFYFSGILLALETFIGYIFFTLLLPVFAPNQKAIETVFSGFSLTRNYFLFMGMLSGNIMRRHLFSVETFAPKMLFELSFSAICETLTLIKSTCS